MITTASSYEVIYERQGSKNTPYEHGLKSRTEPAVPLQNLDTACLRTAGCCAQGLARPGSPRTIVLRTCGSRLLARLSPLEDVRAISYLASGFDRPRRKSVGYI